MPLSRSAWPRSLALLIALSLPAAASGCLEDVPSDDVNDEANNEANNAANNATNNEANNGEAKNNAANNAANNGVNNDTNNGGVELPSCESNVDCRGGEVCREGLCREACGQEDPCVGPLGTCDLEQGYCVGCVEDADCGADQACDGEQRCVFFCRSDEACGEGQFCDDQGQCQEAECAQDADCPGGFRCADALCEPIDDLVCEPGAVTCQGDTLVECSRDGTSQQETACAQGEVCAEGLDGQADCLEQVCEPGAVTCLDAQTAAVCNQDGTEQLTEPCRQDQYCDQGSCLLQVCEPGAVTCQGTSRLTCDERGASAQEVDCQSDCDNPQGCTCSQGACVERICLPGSTQCVGNAVRTCLDDGTGYAPVDRCQDGQQCIMGACLGAECEPGATICSGDLLLTCQSDGLTWASTSCGDAGQVCLQDQGRCGEPTCEPLRTSCDGDVLRTCDARGAGWALEVDCADSGLRCFADRCVEPTQACADPSIRARTSQEDSYSPGQLLAAIPLDTVQLRVDVDNTPQGEVTGFSWSLVEKPEDSTTDIQQPSSATPSLFLDLAGRYVVEVLVEGQGDQGGWGSCQAARLVIQATPDEDLHFQMVWDTDGTDMDLHLMHPNGRWNAAPWDVYYLNIAPDWGRRGFSRDDPSLDIDDVNGYGPENINLNNPEAVTYSLGVYYFSDQGNGLSTATVRTYANGVLAWQGDQILGNRQFWHAIDVTWDTETDSAEVEAIEEGVTADFP